MRKLQLKELFLVIQTGPLVSQRTVRRTWIRTRPLLLISGNEFRSDRKTEKLPKQQKRSETISFCVKNKRCFFFATISVKLRLKLRRCGDNFAKTKTICCQVAAERHRIWLSLSEAYLIDMIYRILVSWGSVSVLVASLVSQIQFVVFSWEIKKIKRLKTLGQELPSYVVFTSVGAKFKALSVKLKLENT